MTMIFDDDIIIHHVAVPGLDGDGMSAPEYSALRNDTDELLGRPVIDHVTDIPDVSGAPGDGHVLVYVEDDNEWVPQPQIGGISTIIDGGGAGVVTTEATTMDFGAGITVTASASGGTVFPRVLFAGTGDANSAARSDHTHRIDTDTSLPIPASGTLSGGTRQLVSGNVSILSDRRYTISAMLLLDLRGQGTGAGFTRPSITIAGNTAQRFGDARTVSGVDMPYSMIHPGVFSPLNVSSVTVSAAIAYQSGDPVNVGAGQLVVTLNPER